MSEERQDTSQIGELKRRISQLERDVVRLREMNADLERRAKLTETMLPKTVDLPRGDLPEKQRKA